MTEQSKEQKQSKELPPELKEKQSEAEAVARGKKVSEVSAEQRQAAQQRLQKCEAPPKREEDMKEDP